MGNSHEQDRSDNKVDNEEVKDEDDDDIQEVCVSGGDKRLVIYKTKHKNDVIVQCIGQLRINYGADVGGGYAIGTGTIFHVDGSKCFVLTCAHNIRMKMYHCINNKCQGKMLYKKACHKCGSNVIKKQDLYKAVGATFVRWGIAKATFGDHEDEYDCDMDECFINDKEYYKYPHPKSGHDIAILFINDKTAADYYRDRCKKIFLVNNFELFLNDKRQIHLFGYPGDKNKGEEMWGMSTPKGIQLTCGFNMKSSKLHLINDQIDTVQGQSGSSIYCLGDIQDNIWIISVHTGGSKTAGQNYGTLMDKGTLQWIKECFHHINIDLSHKIIQKKAKQLDIYEQVMKLNCVSVYRQLIQMGFDEAIVFDAVKTYKSNVNECVQYIIRKKEVNKFNKNAETLKVIFHPDAFLCHNIEIYGD
eukprot:60272_1